MKKMFLAAVMAVLLFSCSDEYKAKKAVSNFIVKFSTNPETYESIDFLKVENDTSQYGIINYKITHMYRIKDKNGIKKVITHTFKMTKSFNVYVDPFEEFE